MTENIVTDIMHNVLSDHTHGLDLDPQGKTGIKCDQQRCSAVKDNGAHIFLRNTVIHDILKKDRDCHGKRRGRKH